MKELSLSKFTMLLDHFHNENLEKENEMWTMHTQISQF